MGSLQLLRCYLRLLFKPWAVSSYHCFVWRKENGIGREKGKGTCRNSPTPSIPDFTSPTSIQRFTLYSNSLSLTFHECRSPQHSCQETPWTPRRGPRITTLEPHVQGAGLQWDPVFRFLSRVSPVPTSPSQALLGQHREPGISEATFCQVCKLVSLQSLNF